MFHLISMAQAMLLNPDKRKFVDTKLAQSRAAAARRAVMDSKRKVKVDVSVAHGGLASELTHRTY